MKILVSGFFLITITSCCTLSLTNVCTVGESKDVVDGQQTQDQKPNLNLELPNL